VDATAFLTGQSGFYWAFTRCQHRETISWVRVVAARIEQDATMQRRMAGTARRRGGRRRKTSPSAPWRPCRPTARFPMPIDHVSRDDGAAVLAAEHDLCGPLLDLVTAVPMIDGALLLNSAGFHRAPPALPRALASCLTDRPDGTGLSRPCRASGRP
jgi:hypothetical protein